MKRVHVFHDDDMTNPCVWGGWTVHSFSRRHRSFRHPEGLITEAGKGATIGVRRKLEAGTAFVLSYFEHGSCCWSLMGEGPQCRFDGVRVAGYIECRAENVKQLPRGYAAREKAARAFLEAYTAWCNGWVYEVQVVDLDEGGEEVEEALESVGDVYDVKQAISGLLGPNWRAESVLGNTLAKDYY